MTTESDLEKIKAWFTRDDLLSKVISQKNQESPTDLEFSVHPNVLALIALTGEGEKWMDRYKDVLHPTYLIELHEKTGDYISIHKIRLLNLAYRCDMTYALVGTEGEFEWWNKFRKTLLEDMKTYQTAANEGATFMVGPTALRWTDAFKSINKNTTKL